MSDPSGKQKRVGTIRTDALSWELTKTERQFLFARSPKCRISIAIVFTRLMLKYSPESMNRFLKMLRLEPLVRISIPIRHEAPIANPEETNAQV